MRLSPDWPEKPRGETRAARTANRHRWAAVKNRQANETPLVKELGKLAP